ncbi:prepilin-type N-terminal cleavage/methylation domain-containing protein [Campylobacter sp. FMV-PI01]|uniref:Prepilin-type N-terminal cleavage/methylation domain-containing protein n=1 Tax=Campylobacter portucalensis TaxID=2608384 RepID=A0A6L5WJF1_9BACT|nr:prepilin-type N-terminal cleavage/methylation domain-containing protein [Campylobacter portucalensis]MSN97164.1 prepilin-type N-terminal cleavage/methylation domain-containing protein [Campylobacter portucalensis]
MKKAFTLIELLFVIVVLSILSLIGTDIYLNVYKNYAYSKSINALETKASNAVEQIATRLSYRIPQTTIAREAIGGDMQFIDLGDDRHKILEWYGISVESQNIHRNKGVDKGSWIIAGWSGFIDINRSGVFRSIGSKLERAGKIIDDLYSPVPDGKNNLAIIFIGGEHAISPEDYGYTGDKTKVNHKVVAVVDLSGQRDFNVKNFSSGATITERYYLSHTAYAIVPGKKDATTGLFDIYLYYNYRPWLGETYLQGKHELLIENATQFKFRGNNGNIEFELCVQDLNMPKKAKKDKFIICKKEAVF